jgi:hypothetical protein
MIEVFVMHQNLWNVFLTINKWFNMPSLHLWLKPWTIMSCQLWIILLQQLLFLLIGGCLHLNMIHLLVWLISSIHIEYLAMWQWDCLKLTHVKDLLSSHFLCGKLITYVKDESGNLWGWQIAHKKLWPSTGNKNIKRIRRMTLLIEVSIFAFLSISLNKHVASPLALDWNNCVKLNNANLTSRQ